MKNQFAIEILKERISILNEGIRTYTNFIRRKKYQRYGLTKKIARERIVKRQNNRDALKLSIKQLETANQPKQK